MILYNLFTDIYKIDLVEEFFILVEPWRIGMNSLRTERLREIQIRELKKQTLSEMYLREEQDYLEQQEEMQQSKEIIGELNEGNV